MYSQQEIDDAVASGVITAEAADALRAHIERQRSTVIADEEQFRLITGFNDIFVSIAAAILLFAVGWIGQMRSVSPPACHQRSTATRAELPRAARRRRHRMGAGPILHRQAADGAALDPAAARLCRRRARDRRHSAWSGHRTGPCSTTTTSCPAHRSARVSAAIAAGAAWLHWRRFHVPITVAAGAAAVAGLFLAVC